MLNRSLIYRLTNHAKQFAIQYHAFLLILGILCSLALGVRLLLFAQGVTGRANDDREDSSPYSCSSQDTPFASMNNLDTLQKKYLDLLSGITEERINYLSSPSRWSCTEETESETIERLQDLADSLPGWSRETVISRLIRQRRPVTFESFSSIVAELLRVYECRLTELREESVPSVLSNADFPEGTLFCCKENPAFCADAGDQSQCTGEVTLDPLCDGNCKPGIIISDILTRIGPYRDATVDDRFIARLTTERMLLLLRSFDLHFTTARNVQCALRMSLDLNNELSLLSDGLSCLPRLWDSATSLHDPKQP